jgi:hypothetical protein
MKVAGTLRFLGVLAMSSSAAVLPGCGESGGSGLPDGGQVADAGTDRVGLIQIHEDRVVGSFRTGATIVRRSDAPGCVIHGGLLEALSPAGVLSVGGPIVGQPGGPEQPIVVGQSSTITNQYLHLGTTYPPATDLSIEVELSASELFPAMPTQTLRPPGPEAVVVLSPVPAPHPTGVHTITVPSTEDFELTWRVPTGEGQDRRMFIGLTRIGATTVGAPGSSIHCSFPLSAGRGTIPHTVLSHVLGGVSLPTSAIGTIAAGDHKEFAQDGVSYVLEVTRSAGSTAPEGHDLMLVRFE